MGTFGGALFQLVETLIELAFDRFQGENEEHDEIRSRIAN